MSNEKSRLAVSRNLISTASISLLKSANERLKERCERFTSSCKRQISSRQKDLLNQRRRFQPDRFNRRIRQEYECLCDWRNRFLLRFRSELNIRKQQLSHLSGRFRWESMIAFLENEKYKLATKAPVSAEILYSTCRPALRWLSLNRKEPNMDISITDQDGNTLEITLGSDVSLVDIVSGSDSTLAWSEISENTQEMLYQLSDQCSEAVEAVKAEAAKNLDDLLDIEDLDDNEPFEADE